MSTLAYPRLPNSAALVRLHDMRNAAAEDPRLLADLAAFTHPMAQPVPTGASLATPDHIAQVRQAVTGALGRWLNGAEVPRAEVTQFDIALGKVLHESLRIVPADAAHEETWSFLASMVFPDVVWARFPSLHQDRVLGKPRNVLRRAWHRHDVVGDLQSMAERPLGEDELTGIFERTAVASNRRLARAMAAEILASAESNRSEFARRMSKQVTRMTGPLLLDILRDDELRDLVVMSAEGRTWPDPASIVSEGHGVRGSLHDPELAGAAASEGTMDEERTVPRTKATGDLVRQFHKDMVAVAVQSQIVLGYRPMALLGMIDDLGGVEAARRIVGSEHPSKTFVTLWENNRLEYSVEFLVLDAAYEGLFGPEVMERAAYRLREHGANPPNH